MYYFVLLIFNMNRDACRRKRLKNIILLRIKLKLSEGSRGAVAEACDCHAIGRRFKRKADLI